MQTTIGRAVAIAGTGLHSGRPARVSILPARAGHGIWFRRRDLRGGDAMIPALWDSVVDTSLNTTLGNDGGARVSTVEHLMAALAGTGVTNALVEIDGPEVPILDGSARRFAEEIRRAGIVALAGAAHAIRILRRIEVREGAALAALEPGQGFEIRFEIDFPGTVIGRQTGHFRARPGGFTEELAECRTFCRREDIERMRAAGLALGGTLENAVVVDGAAVLNPEGFRRPDECVRHKMLDALGDLALAGSPIEGVYTGIRAGHALTNRLLRRLFAEEGAFEVMTLPAARPRRAALSLAG